MNKALKIVMGSFILALAFSPFAHADLEGAIKGYTAGDKLGRGLLNIVSSPLEIVRTVNVQNNVKGPAYGWTGGLVEGLGRMVERLGTGAIDVVTFPFNFPDKNMAPLIQPDYPWEKWDAQYL